MGQKTNPNILRLGKLKEWKSKYIAKKPTESSTLIFQNLEIKKFIFQFFEKNELKIQDYRIYYSENSLHIFIAYYNSIKPLLIGKKIKTQFENVLSKPFQKKIASIKKTTVKKQLYATKMYNKTFDHPSQARLFQNHYLLNKKTHRLNAIKNLKTYIDGNNYKTLSQQNANLFVSKILKGLSFFTHKKRNIFINLKQTNKETALFQTISKKDKHILKENFLRLRKFQQNEFFKNGLNVLYSFVVNRPNPLFLAKFIGFYLKKLKRPNFFLRFLKLALKILIARKFSQFKQIQIKIKGRFNGAPRSSHKFINIGKNIPVLTLNSDINYEEFTTYTSNGTFGIKIWTYRTI